MGELLVFNMHRSHLCPRLEATFPVAIPESAEVHCNMLQCCATKWYLIHLSLIWIFHEYKYSESDGGTQTQQNGFILRWNYFQKWHLQFDTRSCWIWESFLGILCFKWQSANITETHGASGKVTSWRPGVELGDMRCSTSLSLWCPISISVYIYIDTVIKSTLQKKIALQSEHGSLRRGSFCFAKGFV